MSAPNVLDTILNDHPEIYDQVTSEAKKIARRAKRNEQKRKRPKYGDKSPTPRVSSNNIAEKEYVSSKKELPRLVPLSSRQKPYIRELFGDEASIIIAAGVWGSGKTGVATQVGIRLLLDDNSKIQKLAIARPAISGENGIGFEPGDKNDKLAGWCAPVIEELNKALGSKTVELMIQRNTIELLNIDQIKGRTFNDTFLIIDEAEDLSFETIKTIIARHGRNSKTVLTGDVRQKDRGKRLDTSGFPEEYRQLSGFATTIKLFEENRHVMPNTRVFVFDDWLEDCVRSPESRDWGMLLEGKGLL